MEEKTYLKWYNKVGYGTGDIAGNVVYALSLIHIFKDADKVILHSRLVLHVKAKLTVHGFELIA